MLASYPDPPRYDLALRFLAASTVVLGGALLAASYVLFRRPRFVVDLVASRPPPVLALTLWWLAGPIIVLEAALTCVAQWLGRAPRAAPPCDNDDALLLLPAVEVRSRTLFL